MALPQPAPPFTADDYLRWEAEQPEKHEYVRGETLAMGGASRRHVTISGNVFNALDDALDGTPCRAYMADMKVQAAADEAYFYPDVLVTCDAADHRADQFMRAPKLIVEVLSPATAAYDRGDKFAAYRRIASLQEFVLIDPDTRRIEHYQRTQGKRWELQEVEPEQPLQLHSLEVVIAWQKVFRNVDWVSQDECKVEIYRRRGDIGGDIITFEPGDPVSRVSVELTLPMADTYFEAGVACAA